MKWSAARRAVRGPSGLGAIAVGTILLVSCVTTAPIGEKSTERTVAFPTYTVPAPEGEGWGVERDAAKERVFFRKKTTLGPFENVLQAQSTIAVFKVPFSEEGAKRSEEALANGYLEEEHQDMLERGVATKTYRLGEVKKAVETMGGRKLYAMRYTTERPGHKSEAALFVYVPPDYVARRAFYGFLIEELWETGSTTSPGLGGIEPVIAGFTLRPGTLPAGSHPAN